MNRETSDLKLVWSLEAWHYSGYLTQLLEEGLSFVYDYQRHLQKK